jgi:hypothetical protein
MRAITRGCRTSSRYSARARVYVDMLPAAPAPQQKVYIQYDHIYI